MTEPDTVPVTRRRVLVGPGLLAEGALLAGAGVVVAAGAVVRLVGLGRQGYWGDELFSVHQARGSLGTLWDIGLREVHPPLYALLLSGWVRIGGTAPTWTRLLSALLGVLTLVVAWTSLRGCGVSRGGRALAAAATAASGFAVVYAQETRSYALLLLAATGLTGATVRLALAGPATAPDGDRRGRARRDGAAWVGWGVLASATHLFGLVLAIGSAVVLARRTPHPGRRPLARRFAIVAAPQVLWLVAAIGRPGFPESTGWIPAPTPSSAAQLATTVFAAGGLEPHNDGFAWMSPVGLGVVVALAAVGLLLRRGRSQAVDGSVPVRDGAAALVLLQVAVVVLAGTFVVAQVVHIWTLRNLVVVQPALAWAVAVGVPALPRTRLTRTALSAAVLAATSAALVVVAVGIRPPYKNDTGGVAEYLADVRATQPGTTLVIGDVVPAASWFLSTGRSPEDPVAVRTFAGAQYFPRTVAGLERVRRLPGPMVVVYNLGAVVRERVTGKDADQLGRELVSRLGGEPACVQVPFFGFVVVRCDRTV